jgi:hypothetical protein
VLPAYGRGCVADIVPALLGPTGTAAVPSWMPAPVRDARQVVLLVIDGLGWQQMLARPHLTPNLSAMAGGPITTVAPTTTATALASITTGLTPGEHGVVGYRIQVRSEVLNVLRWWTEAGDARKRIPARRLQPIPAFLGASIPVVTKAEFAGSGFSEAHLAGTRLCGWRLTSTLVVEVQQLVAAGESFVYAYYDGVDKVAHEYGLRAHYDAEVAAADELVGRLLAVLPDDACLLVTADHGQVHTGADVVHLHPDVGRLVSTQSGEGRFRWLHARAGAATDLLQAAEDAHGAQAWIVSTDEVLDGGWFGPRVADVVRPRLGDVALVARDDISFDDPADTGIITLLARHGSLTEAEMFVPLVAARGSR